MQDKRSFELTAEMCNSSMDELTIFDDNQSAIQMTKNPQFHGHAKKNADMLTKGMSSDQFTKLRYLAGMR